MKNIHPTYYHDAAVVCACGNTFTTGSTMKKIQTDVCGACHPFFTGKMKFLDTQGRVERFQEKMKTAKYIKKSRKQTEVKEAPTSLKEMLTKARQKAN